MSPVALETLKGKIVFSSGKDGDYDIWRLDLPSGTLTQLTATAGLWNDSPRWSPDGTQVLFTSNRTGVPEVWVMDERGSDQRPVTASGKYHRTPDWTPDGRAFVCAANYDGDQFDLYLLDLNGRQPPRRLTDHPGSDYAPHVASDSRSMVFTSDRSGNLDIWKQELKRQEATRLTTHQAPDYSPRFSPDGRQIAFVSERRHALEPSSDLYVMNADGSQVRRLTSNAGIDRFVAWSPDAQYWIYTSARPRRLAERLMLLPVSGGRPVEVSIDREPLEAEIGAFPEAVGLFTLLPRAVIRRCYPDTYFGTERAPDWAA